MYRTRTFVRTYDPRLMGMFMPGGETYRWFDRNVRAPALALAIAEAPMRSGALRAGHYADLQGSNQYGINIFLANALEHAEWVHEGTAGGRGGRIYPEHHQYLAVGHQSLWPPTLHAGSVSGQDPNPWMREAVTTVLASRRLL